ncbi:hypothetical protein [Fusibacter sp. JL216-2]|uniref:hypothetical protein n=1 Tax=Fusibacter sp. JL216-2 TaxID=3071453 RepID=UPI003D34DC33
MRKIFKRIKSVLLLVKYQPKTFLTLLLYPLIIGVGGLISIAPILIGYKNWYEVEAIQLIMSWVTVIVALLFGFAYIKYMQENLLGRSVSIFKAKNMMTGKWFDGIIVTIKYAILLVALKLFIQFEFHGLIRVYKLSGIIRYEFALALLLNIGLALFLINRLGLHKQMAILKNGEGNYSLREAFKSTKYHWKDLLPLSTIETIAIVWPGLQKALVIYYDFRYSNVLMMLALSFIFSILWMYFETVYKVSCYTEYQASIEEI